MEILKGIAVSPGIVIGRVFVLDDERRRIPRRTVRTDAIQAEHERLWQALGDSIGELTALRERARVSLGEEAAKIFAFHIGMLADSTLTQPMHDRIDKEHVTAEFAVWKGFEDLSAQFEAMPDQTFLTKVDDVRDLSTRVLKHLIGEHTSRLSKAERDHDDGHAGDPGRVVMARDLTPSQCSTFKKLQIRAFATEFGGRTSHTAIFARALGIPAVVGVSGLTDRVQDDTAVIVDGDRGLLILEPDNETLEEYQTHIEARKTIELTLTELASLPCVTTDGVPIQLLGNIEAPSEIPGILKAGGEGVGLYRTEFLYLTSNSEPTEEDHFQAYKQAIELLEGRLLTIRTVDLGADKYTQAQQEDPERNPFLGLRSIRYCLQSLPMFKTQLRAILRASALGPIKVMFPLITSVGELRQGKYLLHDVMEDLDEEGIAYDPDLDIGMMVEVPSAALMAPVFAREAAFFSIGTNDLVQYTLAVDRTNERVASLYNPGHPAVIRLVKEVVKAAGRVVSGTEIKSIPVSCCGESAGEPDYALLLIGLGLRTLSVTSSSIPGLKRMIRSVSIQQCERIARKAATLDSEVTVSAFLRDRARKILPEAFDGRSGD